MNSYETNKNPLEAPIVQSPNHIFIGKLIEQEMKDQNRSANWLSMRLNCDRRNIYDIYRRPYIDTNLLFRISLALGKDFFKLYSDMIKEANNQQVTPPPEVMEARKNTNCIPSRKQRKSIS